LSIAHFPALRRSGSGIGLAIPAAAQTLYGAVRANNTTSNLFILNPATGAVTSTVGLIGLAVT
jgi:hypothetical protein